MSRTYRYTLPTTGYVLLTEAHVDGLDDPSTATVYLTDCTTEEQARGRLATYVNTEYAPRNILHVLTLVHRTEQGDTEVAQRRVRGNGPPYERKR